MSGSMRYEEFKARVGSACMLGCVAGDARQPAFPAVLAEVGERTQRQAYEGFSMLFRGEPPGAPQQGTHAVTFDDGLSCEIFLVPVAREGAIVAYEAVFNRPIES